MLSLLATAEPPPHPGESRTAMPTAIRGPEHQWDSDRPWPTAWPGRLVVGDRRPGRADVVPGRGGHRGRADGRRGPPGPPRRRDRRGPPGAAGPGHGAARWPRAGGQQRQLEATELRRGPGQLHPVGRVGHVAGEGQEGRACRQLGLDARRGPGQRRPAPGVDHQRPTRPARPWAKACPSPIDAPVTIAVGMAVLLSPGCGGGSAVANKDSILCLNADGTEKKNSSLVAAGWFRGRRRRRPTGGFRRGQADPRSTSGCRRNKE